MSATTLVKVCGLKRPEDIEFANSLGVDYIGFVFAPQSKRYVTPAQALELKRLLNKQIQAVGVLVNEPILSVVKLVASGTIDVIQLHGNEDSFYIASLREELERNHLGNTPIIKACSINSPQDIEQAKTWDCDYVLLDSKQGGSGTTFDWALVASMDKPYFLAGGLSLDNVKQAIATCHPMAVDVSSGIETDGVKDFTKMHDFVCLVRNAA